MAIPLEDNVGDIIGKAQRGLRIAESELAKRAGLAGEQMRELRAGRFEETALRAIAPVLNLDADALVDLAMDKWKPDKLENFQRFALMSIHGRTTTSKRSGTINSSAARRGTPSTRSANAGSRSRPRITRTHRN